MRKIIFTLVIITTALTQNTKAQTDTKELFNNVLKAYLDLKNALIHDNGISAQMAGRALYQAVSKVPADQLSPAQRKTWTQYNDKISYDAQHIKSTDDIDHQREHFQHLSKNIYELFKALNINSATLYYQYCPMEKAYWISEDPVIHNPYYGKKMTTCGSTIDSIKAKQ